MRVMMPDGTFEEIAEITDETSKGQARKDPLNERDHLAIQAKTSKTALAKLVKEVENRCVYYTRSWSNLPDYDDILQEARIGILLAVQKYDPSRGHFASCLYWYINHSVHNYHRKKMSQLAPGWRTNQNHDEEPWLVRLDAPNEHLDGEITNGESLMLSEAANQDELVEKQQIKKAVRAAVNGRVEAMAGSKKARTARIARHLWLPPDGDVMSLGDVGRFEGVSGETIRLFVKHEHAAALKEALMGFADF